MDSRAKTYVFMLLFAVSLFVFFGLSARLTYLLYAALAQRSPLLPVLVFIGMVASAVAIAMYMLLRTGAKHQEREPVNPYGPHR